MRKRFLVTGGAGFIGSHLVEALVGAEHDVVVLDDLSTGHRRNLDGVKGRITLVEGDIRDLSTVQGVMDGTEVILHQAALPSVPRSIRDPAATNDVNVMGTLNVLVAARDAGVRRVVYASSSSVYGDAPILPKHEHMRPEPLSPYAVSKLAAELYCAAFFRVYGLETVALRYFNVFGPRQDPHSQYSAVIPRFIAAYMNGDVPTVNGDGEQTRGFTYVENVVSANLLAAKSEAVSGGAVFNVSVDERMSVNELDERLRKLIGVDGGVTPRHGPERPGDVRHSFADIGRAREALGYEVVVSTEEGLRQTVEWYRQRSS